MPLEINQANSLEHRRRALHDRCARVREAFRQAEAEEDADGAVADTRQLRLPSVEAAEQEPQATQLLPAMASRPSSRPSGLHTAAGASQAEDTSLSLKSRHPRDTSANQSLNGGISTLLSLNHRLASTLITRDRPHLERAISRPPAPAFTARSSHGKSHAHLRRSSLEVEGLSMEERGFSPRIPLRVSAAEIHNGGPLVRPRLDHSSSEIEGPSVEEPTIGEQIGALASEQIGALASALSAQVDQLEASYASEQQLLSRAYRDALQGQRQRYLAERREAAARIRGLEEELAAARASLSQLGEELAAARTSFSQFGEELAAARASLAQSESSSQQRVERERESLQAAMRGLETRNEGLCDELRREWEKAEV